MFIRSPSVSIAADLSKSESDLSEDPAVPSEQPLQAAPLVGISIVNYRTSRYVVECLKSLVDEFHHSGKRFKAVVVDNASGDDSLEVIRNHIEASDLSDWVELIASPVNGGFAMGNNLAIAHLKPSQCEYYWLLNPDTRVLPGAAAALIDHFKRNPSIGIAGSSLHDPDGTAQIAAFNWPTPAGELINSVKLGFLDRLFPNLVIPKQTNIDEVQKVDWVAGASFMISAEVVENVGLMDEEFFLYFEEVDYCYEVRSAGYDVVIVPDSKVIHHVGAATNISDMRKESPRRPPYWFASRQRFFQRRFGYFRTICADILWMIGYATFRLRKAIQRQPVRYPPHFLKDFFLHSSLVKGRVGTRGDIGLWDLIIEDWKANGRDWTRPGFRALAAYRLGVWRMKIRNRVLRAPFSIFYRYLYRKFRNNYGVEAPYSARIGRRVTIEHQSGIVIHGNAQIGDECIIRQGVTLGSRHLDRPQEAPILGRGVNVGAGAKILGGVRIGDNAVIGANAVVLSDVPAGVCVVGIPAKPISRTASRENS